MKSVPDDAPTWSNCGGFFAATECVGGDIGDRRGLRNKRRYMDRRRTPVCRFDRWLLDVFVRSSCDIGCRQWVNLLCKIVFIKI